MDPVQTAYEQQMVIKIVNQAQLDNGDVTVDVGDLVFVNDGQSYYDDLSSKIIFDTTEFQTTLDQNEHNQPTVNLKPASAQNLGGIKVGQNLSISNGVLSANTYSLPIATSSVLGGIKVGQNLQVAADGTLQTHAPYSLPTATASVLGGVKVGQNLSIDVDGVLSANTYSLPIATASVLGGVKVGQNLSISNGVLSANAYSLPTATDSVLGGIKVGQNLSINENGVLSAVADGDQNIFIVTADKVVGSGTTIQVDKDDITGQARVGDLIVTQTGYEIVGQDPVQYSKPNMYFKIISVDANYYNVQKFGYIENGVLINGEQSVNYDGYTQINTVGAYDADENKILVRSDVPENAIFDVSSTQDVQTYRQYGKADTTVIVSEIKSSQYYTANDTTTFGQINLTVRSDTSGLNTNKVTLEQNDMADQNIIPGIHLEQENGIYLSYANDGETTVPRLIVNDQVNIPIDGQLYINSIMYQPDWNETSTTSNSYIKNKPSFATVATTGSYNDLINKPTIPAATVIVDNLNSTQTTSALSANQGNVLDDKITAIRALNITDYTV